MVEQKEQEPKSKSQLKREMLALRQLGTKLVALSSTKLDQISLSEKLKEAILQAKTFRRSALSRQLKYIGGLILDEDHEKIQKQLIDIGRPHHQQVDAFHEVESWRDALLSGDEALLNELLQSFDNVDRQHLRQLIRNANNEKQLDKPPKSSRALFRYLSALQTQDKK